MLMLQRMIVEIDSEIVFLLEGDAALSEKDGQCLLIDVFVEEGAKLLVYFLTKTINLSLTLP